MGQSSSNSARTVCPGCRTLTIQVTCLGQEVGRGQGENPFLFVNHLDFGQTVALGEKEDELSVKAKHQEHAKRWE